MHSNFSLLDATSGLTKIIKTTFQTLPEDALSQKTNIKSFEEEVKELNDIFNKHIYSPNCFLSIINKPDLEFDDYKHLAFDFDEKHLLAIEIQPNQLKAMKQINERIRKVFKQRLSLASNKAFLIKEHAADRFVSFLFYLAVNLMIYVIWLSYPILLILKQMELACVFSIIGAFICLPFEYASIKGNLVNKKDYEAKKEEDEKFNKLMKAVESKKTLTEKEKEEKEDIDWLYKLENCYMANARIAERIIKTSFGWVRVVLSICLLCMPMNSMLGATVFYLSATLSVLGAILPLTFAVYYMHKSLKSLLKEFKKDAFDKTHCSYNTKDAKNLRKNAWLKFSFGVASNITNIGISILSLATFFIILSNPWVIIGLALVSAALIHLRNYLYAKSNEFKIESSREECMSSISYKDEKTLHYYDTKINVTNYYQYYSNCTFVSGVLVKPTQPTDGNQLTDGSQAQSDEEKLQEVIDETQKIAAWATTEAFRSAAIGVDLKTTSLRDLYKLKHKTTEVPEELTQSKPVTKPGPKS